MPDSLDAPLPRGIRRDEESSSCAPGHKGVPIYFTPVVHGDRSHRVDISTVVVNKNYNKIIKIRTAKTKMLRRFHRMDNFVYKRRGILYLMVKIMTRGMDCKLAIILSKRCAAWSCIYSRSLSESWFKLDQVSD